MEVLEVRSMSGSHIRVVWITGNLDLDHVRAEIRQLTRRRWPRPCAREIKDLNMI
jgi:hypothetical protein